MNAALVYGRVKEQVAAMCCVVWHHCALCRVAPLCAVLGGTIVRCAGCNRVGLASYATLYLQHDWAKYLEACMVL